MNKIDPANLFQLALPMNQSLPLPDDIIYDNLMPLIRESGNGLAASQTCKTMHVLNAAFLERNTEAIFIDATNNHSELYRLIRTFAARPLKSPKDHYALNAEIVKFIQRCDMSCPTQRVLYPEEIRAFSQAAEDQELEKFWNSICAQDQALEPWGQSLPAQIGLNRSLLSINPDMKAREIRNWMEANPAFVQKIRYLNCSCFHLFSLNNLKILSSEIRQFKNLRSLNLSTNHLSTLAPEISELTNLQNLDLSYNRLTELPPEIVQLTNLQNLNLSYNQLTEVPAEVCQLASLQTLYLTGNYFLKLPPQIGQWFFSIDNNLSISSFYKTKIKPEPEFLLNLSPNINRADFTTLPTPEERVEPVSMLPFSTIPEERVEPVSMIPEEIKPMPKTCVLTSRVVNKTTALLLASALVLLMSLLVTYAEGCSNPNGKQ